MRFWVTVLVSVFLIAKASAAGWNETPEWKFSQSLDELVFRCDLQADFDRQQRRYGQRPTGVELSECIGQASKKADEQFKEIIGTTKLKDEIKSVYGKWISYIGSLSPYGRPNDEAKSAFKDAVNNLRVSLQVNN